MSNAKSKWNMLCNVSTDVLHVLFTQKIKKIEEHSVTLANHAPLPPNFQPIFLRKVERFWDLKMPKDPLRKVLRFKYVERSTTRKKGQKGSSRAENVLWPCSCICNFCRFLSDALQFSLFSSHFYSAFLFLPFPKHFFNTFQQSVPQFFFFGFSNHLRSFSAHLYEVPAVSQQFPTFHCHLSFPISFQFRRHFSPIFKPCQAIFQSPAQTS